MPDTIEHDGETVPLPKEVIEQPTSKTSVYRAGELVHDGATGAPPPGVAGKDGPGGSLNELLQWGIAHSDPAELQRRAAAGEVSAPGQIDREIMDMILGQPIVASMRSCLAKLEAAALAADGGPDAAPALTGTTLASPRPIDTQRGASAAALASDASTSALLIVTWRAREIQERRERARTGSVCPIVDQFVLAAPRTHTTLLVADCVADFGAASTN